MWALESPYDPEPRSLLEGTPATLLVALALGLGAVAVLVRLDAIPEATLRVAGVAAAHGALLATALAWSAADSGPPRARRGRWLDGALVLVALLAVSATLAVLGPLGAVAYVSPLAWLWVLRRRGDLRPLTAGAPVSVRALAAGALIGGVLGAHLLVAASLTLGHRGQLGALEVFLPAFAYDVGANVLSAERFFRGALFRRLYERASFRAAVCVSTAACLLRYLVDPLLPKTVEMAVGAVFYLALLSVANCWLLRWSGSLLPGCVSGVLFFAAYRLLAAG